MEYKDVYTTKGDYIVKEDEYGKRVVAELDYDIDMGYYRVIPVAYTIEQGIELFEAIDRILNGRAETAPGQSSPQTP